ncbi:MAG: hypothetical protein FWF85_10355 [Clostridiales bacterium]|jgi:hypothetical protein|nr:hypothetical protein [Clostridiales bacterium]
MNGHTKIKVIKPIDPAATYDVAREIENFCREFAVSDKEHALVIALEGNAYLLYGAARGINPKIIGEEFLSGSIIAHNHPLEFAGQGDSFSRDDLVFAARYETGKQYLVAGTRRNAFEFTRPLSVNEVYAAWRKAEMQMLWKVASKEMDVIWRQEEILKILGKSLKGFEFYDKF